MSSAAHVPLLLLLLRAGGAAVSSAPAQATLRGAHRGGDKAVPLRLVIRQFAGLQSDAAEVSPGDTAEVAHRDNFSAVLYNHMPKAGGSFLKRVLPGAVGKGNLVVEPEFHPLLDKDDDPQTFTIGSIRNPCDYYVSLWAFGSDGKGSFQGRVKRYPDGKALYAATSRRDTKEDVDRFRLWLKTIVAPAPGKEGTFDPEKEPGLETARFALSYGRDPYMNDEDVQWRLSRPPRDFSEEDRQVVKSSMNKFDSASLDCWVRTEHLEADAKTCLSQFGQRGGHVDWNQFEVAVGSISHNPSEHLPCRSYFDAETERLVRTIERPIFELFGYDKCCED